MNVEAIINKVVEGMSTRTVVGEPMEIQGLTLIPIINVSFGFGGGTGDAKSGNSPDSGTGAGGGARMKVAGMLVVKDGDVRFLPTGTGGAIERLMDSIPDLVEKVQIKTGSAKTDGEQGEK